MSNIVVAPASQLALLEACRPIAAALPEGHVLVILPAPQGKARPLFERFAAEARAGGRTVVTLAPGAGLVGA